MTVMTILSVVVVALYLGCYIWKNKELPDSISAMVYDLPKQQQWLWSAWLCLVAVLLFEPLVQHAGGLGWLTCVCLFGTALMPLVNTETRKWHYVLAYATGILSQVDVAWVSPWWLVMWLIMVVMVMAAFAGFNDSREIPKVFNGKGVTIAECICFVALVGSLLV